MLEQISSWIQTEGDYQVGLSLLKQTGFSGFTLTLLETGEDAYNRSRLEKELKAWLCSPNNIPLQQDHKPPGPTMVTEESSEPVTIGLDFGHPSSSLIIRQGNTVIMPKANPIPGIEQEIGKLMDERSEAIAWIRHSEHLGNSEEAQAQRRPYAYRIKQITRQIDDLYSQIDFFQEHGYLPLLAPVETIDERSHLLNIRSNVSRYKKRLEQKNLTPEQRQSYQAKYDQYLAEKQRIEKKQQSTNDLNTSGQQTQDSPIHSTTFS